MLNEKEKNELQKIVINYVNGNLADSRKGVRVLTKLQLTKLLMFTDEILYLADCDKTMFLNFVLRALDKDKKV